MSKMHKYLILIVYFRSIIANKDVVPTFLIDYDRVMENVQYEANPFVKMSSTDFADIIHETIKRSEAIIIFVEDFFCTEDISARDKLGTPYFNLREGLLAKSIKYFPKISIPYQTLNQIFQPHLSNVYFLNIGSKLELRPNFKYIYVYFQDGRNETRTQALRRHDLIINQVFLGVKKFIHGPIVAFYTGKYNPVDVNKLDLITIDSIIEPVDRSVVVRSERALFRFRDVYTLSPSRRSSFRQVPVVAEEYWDNTRLSTKMAYSEFELEFNFEFEPGKWMLDSVALYEGGEEVGRTQTDIVLRAQQSFVCGEPLTIVNTRDGSLVTLSQYQIQPLSGNDSDGNITSFGEPVNCGPYFSSHILMCLMVTFICLAILAYGVATLYSCDSNDRFDDPNGKPLSTAEEHH